MNSKNTKAVLGLLLILGLSQFTQANADVNNLTQLDIRKTQSNSGVEVTLYTTKPYGDNVAVTKKADNKYVILMPNLSGSSGVAPDISGLKDVVSNVDVKSVSDGGHGYTKVTLTATKPLSIKTKLEKSVPVTAEQKAYRELIAKSRMKTYTPNYVQEAAQKTVAKPQSSVDKTKTAEVKKTADVNAKEAEKKVSDVKTKVSNNDKKSEKIAEKTSPLSMFKKKDTKPVAETQQKSIPTSAVTKTVTDNVKNAETAKTATQPQAQPVKDEKPANNWFLMFVMFAVPIVGMFLLFKLIRSSVKNSDGLKRSFIENLAEKPSEPANFNDIADNETLDWQQKFKSYVGASVKSSEVDEKALVATDTNKITLVSDTAESIADTVNKIRRPAKKLNVGESNVVSMKPKSSAKPVEIVEPMEIEIVEPPSANPAPRARKEKIAKDIKKQTVSKKVINSEVDKKVKNIDKQIEKLEAEKSQAKKVKSVAAEHVQNDFEKHAAKKKQEKKVMKNENQQNDEYRISLEQLLHNTPDSERMNLNEDAVLRELEQNFQDITISEDDAIANNMINSVSSISKPKMFKAFEEKMALEETSRTKPAPKRRADVVSSVPLEGKHVNLGYSKLHTSSRVFDSGNLSVGDLIAKSGKFLSKPAVKPVEAKIEKPVLNSSPAEYTMSTIEEFLSLDEPVNKVTAPAYLSDRVAASLAKVKSSMPTSTPISAGRNMSNPLASSKPSSNENSVNGLIVKSGFNIDNERGFYLVNHDGENALIGRIKDQIFVLKKFDKSIDKPIQVRQDNQNVYMVKADNFRSLVEVSGDKMGVLIEL